GDGEPQPSACASAGPAGRARHADRRQRRRPHAQRGPRRCGGGRPRSRRRRRMRASPRRGRRAGEGSWRRSDRFPRSSRRRGRSALLEGRRAGGRLLARIGRRLRGPEAAAVRLEKGRGGAVELVDMSFWHRLVVVGVVLFVTVVVARVIDRRIARRELSREAMTRYRVLRRSVTTTILFVGLLSALLVIPAVRAVAGGLLASSAVLGIVVGFASQRTLGNFVAGLLIAFTQPVRLGDEVTIEDTEGVVEEIGLIYTFVRMENGDRLVIPNEKLASDTIRNATIRSREKVAEITVQVPLSSDLDAVVDRLRTATEGEVFVNDLAENASIVVRKQAASEDEAERVERDLRLRAHQALRAEGVFA